MKRHEFLKHLRLHGIVLVKEGRSHTLYENPLSGVVEGVPRHVEIKNLLIRGICRRLGIPTPWELGNGK
jgi:predicted RNA binding protein YcfA (HicA-like mRNA interferase family)